MGLVEQGQHFEILTEPNGKKSILVSEPLVILMK